MPLVGKKIHTLTDFYAFLRAWYEEDEHDRRNPIPYDDLAPGFQKYKGVASPYNLVFALTSHRQKLRNEEKTSGLKTNLGKVKPKPRCSRSELYPEAVSQGIDDWYDAHGFAKTMHGDELRELAKTHASVSTTPARSKKIEIGAQPVGEERWTHRVKPCRRQAVARQAEAGHHQVVLP